MKFIIALVALGMLTVLPAHAHGKHRYKHYPVAEWHCHYDSYGDQYCHEHRIKRHKRPHYHEDPYRSDGRFYQPRDTREQCIEYRQDEFGIRYCVRER